MEQSKELIDKLKEIVRNDLGFMDQVELFKYLGNDILEVHTKQAYNRRNKKSVMGYRFAKGEWVRFPDIDLVTDCKKNK